MIEASAKLFNTVCAFSKNCSRTLQEDIAASKGRRGGEVYRRVHAAVRLPYPPRAYAPPQPLYAAPPYASPEYTSAPYVFYESAPGPEADSAQQDAQEAKPEPAKIRYVWAHYGLLRQVRV